VHYTGNPTFKTVTDSTGYFTLPYESNQDSISVEAIGFEESSYNIKNKNYIEIIIQSSKSTDVVIIEEEKDAKSMSRADVRGVEVVGEREIKRAACCNLSESFETNASVDVNYTDGITGAKTIRMLGLDGVYVQMLKENVPLQRGLGGLYGLSFTSGAWIKSIQISKGTGSVVNGFESMSGQINLEYQKPPSEEKVLVNVYADAMGRGEVNVLYNKEINDKISTALQTHVNATELSNDRNGDGFLDVPKQRQVSLRNTWNYQGSKWEGQFGAEGLYQTRVGGQDIYTYPKYKLSDSIFGTYTETKRVEAFAKIGYLFPNSKRKGQSFGSQYAFTYHDVNSVYGIKTYLGKQTSGYVNLIYQDEIFNDKHIIKR
jgi:hypothetical protein